MTGPGGALSPDDNMSLPIPYRPPVGAALEAVTPDQVDAGAERLRLEYIGTADAALEPWSAMTEDAREPWRVWVRAVLDAVLQPHPPREAHGRLGLGVSSVPPGPAADPEAENVVAAAIVEETGWVPLTRRYAAARRVAKWFFENRLLPVMNASYSEGYDAGARDEQESAEKADG